MIELLISFSFAGEMTVVKEEDDFKMKKISEKGDIKFSNQYSSFILSFILSYD